MKNKKILIVEEDKFLIKLYSQKLQREGFEVIGAVSGEEGFHKSVTEQPDLIILDLILPYKSGFEVLSDLKLNEKTKNIPVIILSNLGQESDIRRAKELGAETYVVKPDFSVNQLPEIVKEYLLKKKKE